MHDGHVTLLIYFMSIVLHSLCFLRSCFANNCATTETRYINDVKTIEHNCEHKPMHMSIIQMMSSSSFQKGVYDESISSFFRNVDTRYDDPLNIPVGSGRSRISSLKARVGPNYCPSLISFYFVLMIIIWGIHNLHCAGVNIISIN